MIYLRGQCSEWLMPRTEKCVCYYATAQRTHVCVDFPGFVRTTLNTVCLTCVPHRLHHYSTSLQHPFTCSLIRLPLHFSCRFHPSIFSPLAEPQTPDSSVISHNLSQGFFQALRRTVVSLTATTLQLPSLLFYIPSF